MVEKGLIATNDRSLLPRYLITDDENDIYYENLDGERVGKFEWVKLWKRLMRQSNSITKEPLAKAIGLKNIKEKTLIWDMSCGTGKDTLLLLKFGCRVHAFERNKIIYNLLLYHFHRMESVQNFPLEMLSLTFGAPMQVGLIDKPKVIYFDPMYAESANKKSAPRAQMAMFRQFVGEDIVFETHLEFAFTLASERVVLKRSVKSPVLYKNRFSHSIIGKSTRYDVYMIH